MFLHIFFNFDAKLALILLQICPKEHRKNASKHHLMQIRKFIQIRCQKGTVTKMDNWKEAAIFFLLHS